MVSGRTSTSIELKLSQSADRPKAELQNATVRSLVDDMLVDCKGSHGQKLIK